MAAPFGIRVCLAGQHVPPFRPRPLPRPPPLTGTRNDRRTADAAVDGVIGELDRAGLWAALRGAALWQPPQHLSEDEQLAVVLVELADPDHPGHAFARRLEAVLGADGVLRARDAAARQGRLTREAWAFWTRRGGRDPHREDAAGLRFYEPW